MTLTKQHLKNLLIEEQTQSQLTKLPQEYLSEFQKYANDREMVEVCLELHFKRAEKIAEHQRIKVHNPDAVFNDSNYTDKEIQLASETYNVIQNNKTRFYNDPIINEIFETIDRTLQKLE